MSAGVPPEEPLPFPQPSRPAATPRHSWTSRPTATQGRTPHILPVPVKTPPKPSLTLTAPRMALRPRHLQAASGSTSGASECTPNEPRACHHSPTAPAVHTAEPAPDHESPSEGCLPPQEGVGKPKSDRVGLCEEPSGGSQHVWQEGVVLRPWAPHPHVLPRPPRFAAARGLLREEASALSSLSGEDPSRARG